MHFWDVVDGKRLQRDRDDVPRPPSRTWPRRKNSRNNHSGFTRYGKTRVALPGVDAGISAGARIGWRALEGTVPIGDDRGAVHIRAKVQYDD